MDTGFPLMSPRVRIEIAVGLTGAVLFGIASVRYDLFERFVEWSRRHEQFQVHEAVMIGGYLAVALFVFMFRRRRDAMHWSREHGKLIQRLARQEAALSATVDAIPDPLFRFDRSGVLVEAHQTLLDDARYGIAPGRHVTQFLPAAQAERVRAAIEEVSSTGQIIEQSFEFPEWQGHEFWEARFVPVDGGDVLAMSRDFTVLRRQERHAAALAERFRRAFDSAASGIALIDATTGRLNTVNRAGADMLGYSPDELAREVLADLVHPDDLARVRGEARQLLTRDNGAGRIRLRYLRRDGSVAYGLVTVASFGESDAGVPELIAHIVDVTAQEQAQRQLVELLATKDEFIATVSHELRTPLTAVMGFAQLLRDAPELDDDDRRQMVAAIAEQSLDMSDMIEDLLIAARIETDSLTILANPFDLAAEAGHVLASLRGVNNLPANIADPDPVTAVGDPARARQILRNLLTNAMRYGGSSVEVKVVTDRSVAKVAVMDDGAGVPASARDRIFEPYQRAHARSGVTGSVGLGLTVSRRLARMMGGDVTYRRERGLTFFELSLPARAGDERQESPVDLPTEAAAAGTAVL